MKYDALSQLPSVVQIVHRLFRKPELIDIADELDAEPYKDLDRLNTREIVLLIINHIEENGLPDTKKCSESLFEFLLNIDYVNDEGDVIDEVDRPAYQEEPIEVPEAENKPLTTDPECFSFAELRDPSCKKCDVFDRCMVERKKVRPLCYGKLFTLESEECKGCIEAASCRELVEV